jgi:dTDP-glucose 4,6-dehydratase
MKLVVITGCLGLIGSHVTKRCLSMGWRVYGVDKCTYAANMDFLEDFLMFENFTFVEEDIAQLRYLPDCDYVINIAAESHVGNSIIDSHDFIHSNITGVKNLLDLIRKKPTNVDDQPVFFHFSTDEVYGDITEGEHVETDILSPSNPYSASKAAADMLILAWARTYNMKYIILRPTNNYGVGQYPEKLIPICVKHLMRGKRIRLHDRGEPVRNWLHSDDTASAVIKIIQSGHANEIFNVAGGFEQENIQTVKKIICSFYDDDIYTNHFNNNEASWHKHLNLEHKRPGQDVRYALNDDKLRSLGWEPKKKFDEEINKIVKYYKKNFKW